MSTVPLGVRHAALFAILLAATALGGAADKPWVEIKSPHFTVVSSSGEDKARDIAWQFEQIRAVIEKLWPWARVQTTKPILVIGVKGEASMKALAPEFWEQKGGVRPTSVFVTGSDRYYIAVRTDVEADDREGINPYVSSFWSYVALILDSSAGRNLPIWYSRGLAGVLSNTIVRPKLIQIGRLVPWDLEILRRRARIPISQLVSIDRSSPYYTQASQAELFDAESWALVHYLMLGDDGAHREKLNRFNALMLEKKAAASGFQQAFGSADALEKGFDQYIDHQLFQFMQAEVDVNVKAEGFGSRSLSSAESLGARAAFHTSMRRPVEARALIDEARKDDPKFPGSYEVDAMLLDHERKTADARSAYAKAVELDSTNYYAYYRLATVEWRPNPDKDTLASLEKLLDRTVALNDAFASGYALLGYVKSQIDPGEQALAMSRRATALEPDESNHRLLLARVLWNLSRRDEALVEARKGVSLAETDDERQEAQELVDFLIKNSP